MPNVAAKEKISIINMTLEQQVCSLELSKRLKELGVKQESIFFWRAVGTKHDSWEIGYFSPGWLELEPVSAFTVAELGEMLPPGYASSHGKDMNWLCFCEFKRSSDKGYMKMAGTEADARAKMLIYLLEEKLIALP